MLRACPSARMADPRSLRRLLALRALIRCGVCAWGRLTLPVLVALNRLATLLLGLYFVGIAVLNGNAPLAEGGGDYIRHAGPRPAVGGTGGIGQQGETSSAASAG